MEGPPVSRACGDHLYLKFAWTFVGEPVITLEENHMATAFPLSFMEKLRYLVLRLGLFSLTLSVAVSHFLVPESYLFDIYVLYHPKFICQTAIAFPSLSIPNFVPSLP